MFIPYFKVPSSIRNIFLCCCPLTYILDIGQCFTKYLSARSSLATLGFDGLLMWFYFNQDSTTISVLDHEVHEITMGALVCFANIWYNNLFTYPTNNIGVVITPYHNGAFPSRTIHHVLGVTKILGFILYFVFSFVRFHINSFKDFNLFMDWINA